MTVGAEEGTAEEDTAEEGMTAGAGFEHTSPEGWAKSTEAA